MLPPPAFRLTVIPAWSLTSPTLPSISLSHLGRTSDVYHHLLGHGGCFPVRRISRRRTLGCFADEVLAQRVESTVTSECDLFLQGVSRFWFLIILFCRGSASTTPFPCFGWYLLIDHCSSATIAAQPTFTFPFASGVNGRMLRR